MKNLNVLIPDGDSPFTLSIISLLSVYRSINIHVLSSKKWVESRFSRKIKTFSFYENFTNEIDLIDYLKQEIKNLKIDVVLPVSIKMIRLISKHKNEFTELDLNIIVSSINSLNTANNKWELSKFLEDNNLPIPKTFHLNSIKDKADFNFRYPLILKPLSRWNGAGLMQINDNIELENSIQKMDCNKEYIVQEYINGHDYCVNVLCLEGELLAHTIQKGSLPKSNPFQSHLACEFLSNDKLLSIINKIIKKLNWSGVANFDVRFNEEDNQFYIIEINPRFWGSVEASASVGVNFPYLMCLLSLNVSFNTPNYKLEDYISNRGLLRLIKTKIRLKKINMNYNQHNSLKYAFSDPLPKMFKYSNKLVQILTRIRLKSDDH